MSCRKFNVDTYTLSTAFRSSMERIWAIHDGPRHCTVAQNNWSNVHNNYSRISCWRFSSHDERCQNSTDDPWRHRGDMDRVTADTYSRSLSGNQNMYPNKLSLVMTTQLSYLLENTQSWIYGMETGHQLSIVTDTDNRLTWNASLSRFHHKPQFEITSITVWMDRTAQRSQVAAPTWSGKQLTVYAQPS